MMLWILLVILVLAVVFALFTDGDPPNFDFFDVFD